MGLFINFKNDFNYIIKIELSGLSAYINKPLESILRPAVRVVYNNPHCE